MRGCAWICCGHGSAAPSRQGRALTLSPAHTRVARCLGPQSGGCRDPCPSCRLSQSRSPDGEGELARGALAVADQEGSQVIALEQPLLCQVPGDPARVPPARGTGLSPAGTPGHTPPSAASPPCGMGAPRFPVPAGAGSPSGSSQDLDPPPAVSPFPPPPGLSRHFRGGTAGRCGCAAPSAQGERSGTDSRDRILSPGLSHRASRPPLCCLSPPPRPLAPRGNSSSRWRAQNPRCQDKPLLSALPAAAETSCRSRVPAFHPCQGCARVFQVPGS